MSNISLMINAIEFCLSYFSGQADNINALGLFEELPY